MDKLKEIRDCLVENGIEAEILTNIAVTRKLNVQLRRTSVVLSQYSRWCWGAYSLKNTVIYMNVINASASSNFLRNVYSLPFFFIKMEINTRGISR